MRPRIDYIFLLAVIILSAIGTLTVFSASPTMGLKHADLLYYIKRHLFYLLIGVGACFYGFNLDLQNLKKIAFPLFAVTVLLLVLVFIPGVGHNISGASRWIDLGIISLQPSELIKFTLTVFVAKLLAEKKGSIGNFINGVLPVLLIFGLVAVLIIKQPDLGTVLALGGAVFAMLFVAGMQYSQFAVLGLLAIIAVGALGVTSPYRMKRFLAFFDPWQDPQGIGFQIIQSLLAVGSGGFLGLGLGASRQKFFYLPQQFTDFIFAIYCEETGFLGALAVIAVFILFAHRGFMIALGAKDPFKSLLATGLVAWLTTQALINIMVVVGLVPTTGIPLPFISYGGTATIVNLFAVGVILNISKKGNA